MIIQKKGKHRILIHSDLGLYGSICIFLKNYLIKWFLYCISRYFMYYIAHCPILIYYILKCNIYTIKFTILKYKFTDFRIFTNLCNHHHYLILEYFHQSPKKTCAPWQLLSSPFMLSMNKHKLTFNFYGFLYYERLI